MVVAMVVAMVVVVVVIVTIFNPCDVKIELHHAVIEDERIVVGIVPVQYRYLDGVDSLFGPHRTCAVRCHVALEIRPLGVTRR